MVRYLDPLFCKFDYVLLRSSNKLKVKLSQYSVKMGVSGFIPNIRVQGIPLQFILYSSNVSNSLGLMTCFF